jgi:hypothetical protein
VLGVGIPVSRSFQSLVRQGGGDDDSGRAQNLGIIELTQPSTFGMVREGTKGTTIEVYCGAAAFITSSKGSSRMERQVNVVAARSTCIRAAVKVALPDSEFDPIGSGTTQAPAELTKSYLGDPLAALAQDFSSGAKTFTLADFKPSYSDQEWAALIQHLRMLGINQVRVYASVSMRDAGTPRGSLPPSIID